MSPHFFVYTALAYFFQKAGQLSSIVGNHQLFIGWNNQDSWHRTCRADDTGVAVAFVHIGFGVDVQT